MAKIETIGAEQLRAVTGGFLGFRGPNGRFPILRGLFQQAAAGGQTAGGGGCPGGQCPQAQG
ncbi:MAG: hypothetical protein AB7T06_13675 [Kofleriaceae bacterium]